VDPRDLLAPKREYHRVGRGFQVDTSRVSAARQTYERDYEIAPRIDDAIKFPIQAWSGGPARRTAAPPPRSPPTPPTPALRLRLPPRRAFR
jgi:hypothetical protein